MKVGDSVRKAIDDWEEAEFDAAMLHACNAIDGTARKVFPTAQNKPRFVRLLRENYHILGPMGAPGIDLARTRFPVKIEKPTAGGSPDIADVIYTIHRCSHGHGDELPEGFELVPDADGPARLTRTRFERGKVRFSDRLIFGLVAVAVFSPANADQRVPETYYLTFGLQRLPINEWWGRAADFPAVAATDPVPSVVLDFGDWMRNI